MSVEFEGLEEIIENLGKIVDPKKIKKSVGLACALVERTAKQKAPKGSGDLRRSITSNVNDIGGTITGVVYTPLEYAPYVEYGTGIHAEKEGRKGWWVYVEGSEKKGTGGKHYTELEAKEVCEYLRSKGLDAYATNGREPTPFMRPALYENKAEIKRILRGGIKKND